MSRRNLIIVSVTISILSIVGIANYFYRPDWQVERVAHGSEMGVKTIQTIVLNLKSSDFKFSEVMNGMTAFIADMPENTVVISLHTVLGEPFEGKDESTASMQVLIQNDDGTACTMEINNTTGEVQTLANGKLCAVGLKSTIMLRDASAMRSFKNGSIKVFLSFVTL